MFFRILSPEYTVKHCYNYNLTCLVISLEDQLNRNVAVYS